MKTVTREEFQKLLEDYGHHSNVEIPLSIPENQQYEDVRGNWIDKEWIVVLNNGMVYNPFGRKQVGLGNNKKSAERAMKFIKDRVRAYSNVFNFNDEFKIVDE